jgi:hypothetical protein
MSWQGRHSLGLVRLKRALLGPSANTERQKEGSIEEE